MVTITIASTTAFTSLGESGIALPGHRPAMAGGRAELWTQLAYPRARMAAVCPQLVTDNTVRFVGKQPHPPRGVPR